MYVPVNVEILSRGKLGALFPITIKIFPSLCFDASNATSVRIQECIMHTIVLLRGELKNRLIR